MKRTNAGRQRDIFHVSFMVLLNVKRFKKKTRRPQALVLAPTRELARQIQLEATLTTTTGEKKSKTKVKVGGLMQHPRVVDGKKLPHLVLVLSPSKMEAWKTIRLPFKKLFLFRGHVNLRGVLYVFVAGMRMVLHMSKVLHCL